MAERPRFHFQFLTRNFLRATVKGMIATVYRTREEQPDKVREFRDAIECGAISLGSELTKQQAFKLVQMEIRIPPGVRIVSTKRDAERSAMAAGVAQHAA